MSELVLVVGPPATRRASVERRLSRIPEAGHGMFARSDLERGRWITRVESRTTNDPLMPLDLIKAARTATELYNAITTAQRVYGRNVAKHADRVNVGIHTPALMTIRRPVRGSRCG